MKENDVFSTKIRRLAIAIGVLAAGLFCFLSPLTALRPALLLLAAALQPSLSVTGRQIVKWFVWAWALIWSPYLVVLSFLLVNNLPRSRYFMALRVLSTVLALLILWWDIELIVDGVRRIRILRAASVREPRPVALALWILAVGLNFWVGWGLLNVISTYHSASDLYMLGMSVIEAVVVVVFDIYLTWRVVKLRPARRPQVQR